MKSKTLRNPKRVIKNNIWKVYQSKVHKLYNMKENEVKYYRNEKLKEILNYSINHVPYYQNKIYKEFYNSFENNHYDYMNELPVIRKQEVKDNNSLFWSEEKNKLKTWHTTSGTSGKSLKINSFLDEKIFSLATLNYWYSKVNIEKGWKIFLSGFMIPDGKTQEKLWIDKLDKSIYLSIYEINNSNLKYYEEIFSKYRPTMLYGYPSSVYEFCKVIVNSNIINSYLNERVMKIVTTAEVLEEHWKEFMDYNVGKVYNQYGAQEGTHFASTFSDDVMYNHPYFGVIETVNDNYQNVENELGNAIVTSLNKKSMPLIRYEIGDTLSLSPQDNGWDIINTLGGRSEDLILKEDGSKVSLLNFHASKNIDEINLSQIVQKSIKSFDVNINYIDGISEREKIRVNTQFESEMRRRLRSGEIIVKFKEVNDFERGPNGKFKSVIVKNFIN